MPLPDIDSRADHEPGAENATSTARFTPLLATAVLVGCAIGVLAPGPGARLAQLVSPTVLLLVTLLFFEATFDVRGAHRAWRVITAAWCMNFLLVPVLAYLLARMFVGGSQAVLVGLFSYLVAPCTDWFLGFTRLAGGNVAVGSMLLPINMITQLIGYPVLLLVFFGNRVTDGTTDIPATVLVWFAAPFVTARIARLVIGRASLKIRDRATQAVGSVVPSVIAGLILEIFAANTRAILDHAKIFGWCLAAVFTFFLLIFAAGEAVSRACALTYRDQVLLSMTTSARNAPLMLGVTVLALPGQPLTYAAIVIGMLIEFPHLVIVSTLLRRRHRKSTPADLRGQYGTASADPGQCT